jgi:microcystin-dependent protein
VALPTKPEIDFSYTGFAQSLGNNTFPGTQIDNDLANIVDAVDETIDFVSAVIRSDGQLQNAVVTAASLGPDLALGVAPPRPWATATVYVVDQTVSINNSIYICQTAHTSGTFSSDLGAGYWGLVAEFTIPTNITDGAVTEPKHATGGVSSRALAGESVTEPKLGTGAVSLRALDAGISRALTPIGLEADYAGVVAPAGWLFEFGQAVSRTTYSALFAALCPSVGGNTTNGSPTLGGVTVDLRNLGMEGCLIEGANIPGGTTVVSVTANSITMSANATATATGVAARVLPWGAGDGSTTFNLPDARDRVSVGRGNMGVAVAGRITNTGAGNPGVNTSRLGVAGGVDRHAITTAQMPIHGHTAAVTDPGHAHTTPSNNTSTAGGGASPIGSATAGVTGNSTTGITVAIANTGGGEAHPNLPPARVTNKIIYTGVL